MGSAAEDGACFEQLPDFIEDWLEGSDNFESYILSHTPPQSRRGGTPAEVHPSLGFLLN